VLGLSTFAYKSELPFELTVLSEQGTDGERIQDVSFCLDASFRRSAEYEPEEELPQADLQWIVDVRRAVDILQDRFELIPEHIGYVGNSFGAAFGGVIYIGQAAPASLLFQFACYDDFVPVQEAEHYFELASQPKKIAWYENCKHELSAQARSDRALFLCEQLGLPTPSQHILDLLERVPPPVPIGY
jgi:hypothetical protein